MDELASEVGARPDLWRLFKNDPFLAVRCFVGPCVPAQYRLMGPCAWSGAKTTIKDTFRNTMAPLKRRAVPAQEATSPLLAVESQKYYESAVSWKIYVILSVLLLKLIFLYKCYSALRL